MRTCENLVWSWRHTNSGIDVDQRQVHVCANYSKGIKNFFIVYHYTSQKSSQKQVTVLMTSLQVCTIIHTWHITCNMLVYSWLLTVWSRTMLARTLIMLYILHE